MKQDALRSIVKPAKASAEQLSLLSTSIKNKALLAMAREVRSSSALILKANGKDIRSAVAGHLEPNLIARLELTEKKIDGIAHSLEMIARLPDPVGRVLSVKKRPNGLLIRKISVPIGVIFIIYESRPNVTADCMALCLKSGNSVILKGGREAHESNKVIFEVLSRAAYRAKVPKGAFGLVPSGDRDQVKALLQLSDDIDVVIPRGGEGLIREVAAHSKIPVIKHYKGVCHVFVDKEADFKKAQDIVLNAKTQNPSVCNAMETLLVHERAARKFLPAMIRLLKEKGVQIRGCAKTQGIVPDVLVATEEDWHTEYLDLVLAVRVVKDVKAAAQHIAKYGSKHSDAILTKNKKTAEYFCRATDSACVFVNASTRFNDGGEFGMGAEMGISTDKLHARGPVGLEELTTYKYLIVGNGQVRG